MSQPVSSPLASQAGPDREFARRRMVDTQVRPVGVSDPRILTAMRALPRERFVPPDRADLAYMDQDIALGNGRFLTEPRVIARLLQVLVPLGGERALVIGAGPGYAACLLSALGLSVVALEQNADLAAVGRRLVAEFAPGVVYRDGPLAAGCPDAAPFDLILIDGAVVTIPDAFAAQLGTSGRLAGVLSPPGRVGTGILADASPAGLRPRTQFDAATPLLPELAPAPRFSF